MRLLLVEDDIALGEGICDGLRQEGTPLTGCGTVSVACMRCNTRPSTC